MSPSTTVLFVSDDAGFASALASSFAPSTEATVRHVGDVGTAREALRSAVDDGATDYVVRDRWTDRQAESLKTAYLGGFSEWPRLTTSETLAEALGITPPTFQYHLRAAERKLVEAVFD